MTIVDFVRACLDEDESDAKAASKSERDPSWWYDLGNPSRVLADIAAKRRILDEYTESASRTVAHGAPSNAEVRTAALADVIQILAEAYADRPGWREEWRR